MPGAQQMVDIDKGLFGQRTDRFRRHIQKGPAAHGFNADPLAGQFAIGRRIGPQGEHAGI